MKDTTHIWASKDPRTQGNKKIQDEYVLVKGIKKITIVKKRRERKFEVKSMDVMLTMSYLFML